MKLSFVLRTKKNELKLSTRNLDNFIERIKKDTKDRAVERRREQYRYGGGMSGYDNMVPSHLVYPSAEFEKDANGNLRMRAFNGIVAITIDHLEKQADIRAVKQASQILHYTLAAFIGPTGQEVILLVRIAKQDADEQQNAAFCPTEEEADALCQKGYRLASALYQAILPKPIRREAVTLRSCFHMPLDEKPYYNPKAVALPVSGKPESWGQGIWEQTGDTKQGSKQPDSPQESSVLSKEAEAVSRETRQLVDFLNMRYEFRYNTMMGYTEYRNKQISYSSWQPIDDRCLKGLAMEVRLGGIDARDNDIRRYVHSNMIRPYEPIIDYLWDQYDKWDGKDHIRKLARTVPTKNAKWEDWFYTWFLGMVKQWQASTFTKYGNQAVPLLISTQGWNKTTFCEQLLPPELRWGYTGNLQMDDKRQVLQQMSQMLLINLDEFNQISPRTQQGFLKNIITLSSVKIKRPYGRHVEDFPRRASFIATTNQADVLADPSGSRRFLGIELTGPIDVSISPNYEQLYAQAMQALHNREPYYFGPAETQQIMESNKQFSVKTAAEQFFLDYFEPATNDREGEWISASAIFNFLKSKVGVSLLKPANVAAFGRKLSAIPGLKKRETKSNSEYFVKRKKE